LKAREKKYPEGRNELIEDYSKEVQQKSLRKRRQRNA